MSQNHDDFDFEPQRGLPQVLPPGERLLWQGSPRWQDLAIHAFHARKVIWYFAALGILSVVLRLAEGVPATVAIQPLLWMMAMGLVAAAMLTGLAWLSGRTSVYSITNKRLVFRVGMALPVSINLPFRQIDGASLRLFRNGSGDLPLKVCKGQRVAYLMLWPHARPFHFANPEPCLRCIPNADEVASLLAGALNGLQMPQNEITRANGLPKLKTQAVAA
ncbi:photosynthetic complex putative assembly protein PuhB [Aestuariivirga sp.]|jgi:hypothetical protein|uniref:photosynthetic complex putative assembly protein PuhB n=1 Tax=Aestuariivirga sp. TaxID=2650926 RepID=UPI003784A95E